MRRMVAFLALLGSAADVVAGDRYGFQNQYRNGMGTNTAQYRHCEHQNTAVLFQFVTAPTTPVPVLVAPAAVPAVPAAPAPLTEAQIRLIVADAVRQALRANTQPPPIPQAASPPPVQQAPPPASAPAPAKPTADPGILKTYQAAAVLAVSCMECHSSPGRGKTDLFNAQGAFDPKVSRRAIWESVKDDSMPKRPQKLTAAEKDLIRDWAGVPKE